MIKNAYTFIAGRSVVTPIGVAVAVALVCTLRGVPASWLAGIYTAILVLTLAASTFERVR